jgi:hypothetical protein
MAGAQQNHVERAQLGASHVSAAPYSAPTLDLPITQIDPVLLLDA